MQDTNTYGHSSDALRLKDNRNGCRNAGILAVLGAILAIGLGTLQESDNFLGSQDRRELATKRSLSLTDGAPK